MNKLTKYKKNILSRNHKIIISFIILILTIGIGFSALVTNLSMSGSITVKEYDDPDIFNKLVGLYNKGYTCIKKENGQVTDEVGNTVTASNVYFDSCANKQHVIFNGLCWNVIRTTETGGIKLMYNGDVVDGKCEKSRSNHNGIIGTNRYSQELDSSYLYGSSFTYDITNGTFTLTNTETATWSDSTYQNLIGKFTCKDLVGTCSTLYSVNGYYSNTKAMLASYTIGDTNYTQIGTSPYNSDNSSISKVGYMFNKSYKYNTKYYGYNTYPVRFSSTFIYDSGTNTYTLSGTTKDINDWSTEYSNLNNVHYTCWNSTGSCNTISYAFNVYSDGANYIEITSGKSINDALVDMLSANDVNTYNSTIKGIVDAWYSQNMDDKTSMLEDTVFCNNRSILSLGSWDANSTSLYSDIRFLNNGTTTSLACTNETDQFAVRNNKAKLTYPVSLLQNEEMQKIYRDYTLSSSGKIHSISPTTFNKTDSMYTVGSDSYLYFDFGAKVIYPEGESYSVSDTETVSNSYGVRPVISLKNGTIISSGDGSETSPWVVDESVLSNTIGTYSSNLKTTYLSNTYKDKIKTITLQDSINIPNDAVISWDISANQDNSVKAYLKTNSSDNTMYDLYIQGNGHLYSNPNSNSLFYNMSNLESINNLTILDTSKTTDMSNMFAASYKLTSLDISNFDTSKVTNMQKMFGGVDYDNNQDKMMLTTITGLNSIDTSNVVNMAGLFLNCGNIITIDISGFNTSNVVYMNDMFNNVNDLTSKLTTIIFGPNFDTSKAKTMRLMFSENPQLVNLDMSGFNTSSVIDFSYMFSNCSGFTNNLNVTSFNTSNATNMMGMFFGCANLVSLNVSNFNTSKVTNMVDMFSNNQKIQSLNISNFVSNSVTDFSGMFHNCYALKNLNISSLTMNSGVSYTSMFLNMPTKSSGAILHVKDTMARDWILNLTGSDRPSDWDTTNVLVA